MQNQPLALHAISETPYNAETPLPTLIETVTPIDLAFVRNHFDVPKINPIEWTLKIHGAVEKNFSISLCDIQALASKNMTVVMECAGNGRTRMNPVPSGATWTYGAVSVFQVKGIPVRSLLEQAGVNGHAFEVLFIGADRGEVKPGRTETFARSLPLEVAMASDTLLVWEMNGQPLTPNHGYPLRLIVPRWYGMASVKWLTEIKVLAEPFQGFFQLEHYIYLDESGTQPGQPVQHMRVRALIVHPAGGTTIIRGKTIEILGVAWSTHQIVKVEISLDGGKQWLIAELDPSNSPNAMQNWRYMWSPEIAGTYNLMCRATDSQGNTQPITQRWNRLGYGNNGAQLIVLQVI